MRRESILIIKPSSLGDVVHTLPAVAAIRAANPHAEITWLINPEWATLLRGNPDIDHVRIFPRGDFRGLGAPAHLLPWLRQTRKLRPDIAVDFQGLLRSALIGKFSGARQFFGLSDAREGSRFFYNKVAQVERRSHAVERYLKLAEAMGATVSLPLCFPLPSGDPLPRFDDYPPFILLHPFARGRGKSLSDTVVEEICRSCSPTRVVVVGKSKLRIAAPENCVDLCGQTTLLQLIRLIRTASFVITVDSGPMHIAAALSDRLVSIHTWTDPRRVGPYNRECVDLEKWRPPADARFFRADQNQTGKALSPPATPTRNCRARAKVCRQTSLARALRQHEFRQGEIRRERDLEIELVVRHEHHRTSESLDRGNLVRDRKLPRGHQSKRLREQISRKNLRRLHRVNSVALDGAADDLLLRRALQRVGHRPRQCRRLERAGRREDALDLRSG